MTDTRDTKLMLIVTSALCAFLLLGLCFTYAGDQIRSRVDRRVDHQVCRRVPTTCPPPAPSPASSGEFRGRD